MDETLIWCALIGAVAYVTKGAFPSYYELTNVRRHSLDNMRDDIIDLEKRVDAINNAVDDNEQELMGAIKKIEDMQSDIAGHLTRLDDTDKTVSHNCLRLATLEGQMWKAKAAAPANEVRHD